MAAEKLASAARIITAEPGALELRRIQTLAEVGAEHNSTIGIICLLSALRFHQITTQSPHQIWLAIAPKARAPKRQGPPLRIIRASGEALTAGVEHHRIVGVDVGIYSVAKTVADCFKYRRRVGLDVALEALRDCRRERLATRDEIWHFAEIDRVATVMRPYLEGTA